jgi:hypothetical protein
MPDRDDIFGRFWLNFRRGNIDAAEKTALIASDVLEKGRLYDGLKQTLYSQTSYPVIRQAMMTAEGRADLEPRMTRSEESPAAGPFAKTGDSSACDLAFDDKAYIDYRFAGDVRDPLSGVAMRRTIEGGLVAFQRNLSVFWRFKAAAHRRGIRIALTLPPLVLAVQMSLSAMQPWIERLGSGNPQASDNFGFITCALPLALPIMTYAIGRVWLAGARADHDKWTNGIQSVSRRNARQISADMAGQTAATQGLIDEILVQASHCTDEARLQGLFVWPRRQTKRPCTAALPVG